MCGCFEHLIAIEIMWYKFLWSIQSPNVETPCLGPGDFRSFFSNHFSQDDNVKKVGSQERLFNEKFVH
jgi:hypothetical protein